MTSTAVMTPSTTARAMNPRVLRAKRSRRGSSGFMMRILTCGRGRPHRATPSVNGGVQPCALAEVQPCAFAKRSSERPLTGCGGIIEVLMRLRKTQKVQPW